MIEVRFAKQLPGITAGWVRGVVKKALGRRDRAMSVYVTGDREMRRINKRHLDHDYATDVIAFDYGEIVASADTARRMAGELGISFKEELARYLVHGTLHLVGYDDKAPAARRRMHARQEAIVEKLNDK